MASALETGAPQKTKAAAGKAYVGVKCFSVTRLAVDITAPNWAHYQARKS